MHNKFKFNSWDTSKKHRKRSIDDIKKCASSRSKDKDSYGVKYAPLLFISLDHVVPDELHLFLRIMDVLIENIISQAVESDIKASRRQTDVLSGQKLQTLVSKINSCRVSFQIWKKRDSKNLDWTSLGGAEKKKVLSQLPKSFPEFLPPEHCQQIAKLWKVHVSRYMLVLKFYSAKS